MNQPQKIFPIVAGAILVDPSGRLLLQHRDANAPTSPNKWSTPGGHLEPGETLLEAVRRELIEEIGLDVGDTLQIFANLLICRNFDGTLHIVQAPSAGPIGEAIVRDVTIFYGPTTAQRSDLELNEGDALEFFTPAEALQLDLAPSAAHILPQFVASPQYHALITEPITTIPTQ